jgi:cell division protein FtsB
MMRLLRLLLSWSVRRILLFVIVVAAMIAFVQALSAWNRLPALADEVASLERNDMMLRAEIERLRREAAAAPAAVERMEQPMLRDRLVRVRAAISEIEARRASGVALALQAARGEGSALARAAGSRFRLELLRREEAMIAARLEALGRGAQVRGLSERIAALDGRIAALEQTIAEIERRHPLLSRVEQVPVIRELQGPWQALRASRQALGEAQAERARLTAARQGSWRAFTTARDGYRGAAAALRSVQAPADALRARIEEKRAQLEGHWARRVWAAIRPVLGWALWVIVLVTLVPPAVKAFWFFVVAPFAVRLRPIRIDPTDLGDVRWADERRETGAGTGSAVSWRIRLRPGEEALLRPEYLQSSPGEAASGSQMLLSLRMPLGSLASGLYGLTRIRAEAREAMVNVSATADLVDEVGVIEVAEGSSLVFRPRGLIGVVQSAGRPLAIERVWTLCAASWLTLRLRHIVFRGPCALIVKGARGVALEPAAGGRRVSGAAMMGWSAGLDHKVDRSEAFLAYLTGRQSLFLDRLEGPRGRIVYEEMPRGAQAGLLGRGIEGLGDALLKIVGI